MGRRGRRGGRGVRHPGAAADAAAARRAGGHSARADPGGRLYQLDMPRDERLPVIRADRLFDDGERHHAAAELRGEALLQAAGAVDVPHRLLHGGLRRVRPRCRCARGRRHLCDGVRRRHRLRDGWLAGAVAARLRTPRGRAGDDLGHDGVVGQPDRRPGRARRRVQVPARPHLRRSALSDSPRRRAGDAPLPADAAGCARRHGAALGGHCGATARELLPAAACPRAAARSALVLRAAVRHPALADALRSRVAAA
mmetsp:Transcript_8992/g.28444  ORF Transcript_8992/g.28444 Transcript_8992/m.28444 type:complete len:255 (+) Transcript_8992:128-892(+)